MLPAYDSLFYQTSERIEVNHLVDQDREHFKRLFSPLQPVLDEKTARDSKALKVRGN